MPGLKWIGASSKRISKTSGCAALFSIALLQPAQAELPWFAPRGQVSTCSNDAAVQVWLPQQLPQRAQVLEVLSKWQAHPLHAYVPCFSLRYYHDATALACTTQGERGRQRCQPPVLPRELHQRQLIFTDALIGSASAQQIVLPTATSVAAFAHEVGHWLGFADEYRMSAELAQPFCHGRYRHPSLNVVTTAALEMSSAELQALWQRLPWRDQVSDWQLLGQSIGAERWRLGSTEATAVGLFASRTCDEVPGRYSWKPVARMTAMEYHDVTIWPKAYLKLLENAGGLRNHNDRAK